MREGPLWLRLHEASGTHQAADGAQGRQAVPVSWEEAAQAAAAKLKAVYDARWRGCDRLYRFESHFERRELILLQRMARADVRHRTTSIITALRITPGLVTGAWGRCASDSLLTMEQLYKSQSSAADRK